MTKFEDKWILAVPVDPWTEPAAISQRQRNDVGKAFAKLKRRLKRPPTVEELVDEVMLPGSVVVRRLAELDKTPSPPAPAAEAPKG